MKDAWAILFEHWFFYRCKEFLKHLQSSWGQQLTLRLKNTMKNSKQYTCTFYLVYVGLSLSLSLSLLQIEGVWRGHASGHQ